ncbi:PAS domain S-box-containing protein [Actinoplanes campanulatus]|uniref:histidine kinase n=1 Tax=Actinoplanes campanulatus TaxID=113559 RepID=A0A7W5AGJ4_9ACTN|nr:PAS domain S-box protein [Actinoplanes campanulatus]MBB3095569.1 PAS domain S-box-containing protein [Actinoplanes campanulatus]
MTLDVVMVSSVTGMRHRVLIWRITAVAATGIGTATLAGHVAQVLEWWSMSPTSAVLAITGGAALLFSGPVQAAGWRPRTGRFLALLMVAIAFAALVAALSGAATLVDWLSGTAMLPPTGPPPIRALVAYLLIGMSLVLLDVGPRHGYLASQLLAAAAALVMGVAELASLFGLVALYSDTLVWVTPPAAQVCVLLLAFGVTVSRPGALAVQVFGGRWLGSRAVRRLAPAVAAVVVLIALSPALMARIGVDVESVGADIIVSLLLLTLYLVLLRSGHMLNEADQRRQAVIAELRGQRDFNDIVLTALIEGVVTLAPDGRVLSANERWSQMTGYPADEVIGIHPPYPWWPDREQDLQVILGTEGRMEFSTDIQRRDGENLPILATVCPLRTDDHLSMLIITCRDLTDRDREQAERRRMAEELDHFFTLSGDMLCIASADGYFTRVNPAWTRTFGYTPEEVRERPYLAFVHPDDIDNTVHQVRLLTEGHTSTIDLENRYRARDGSYRWLSWSATPAAVGSSIYAVARDITDQRAAGEAQARLAAIVESTADAIIGRSLDGTILSWNPAAERIYGYPADDMIGHNVDVLYPPALRDEPQRIRAQLVRGETVHVQDTTRVRRDGTAVHLAITISPIRDLSGEVVGAASIARDITDAKRAEKRFRQLVLSAPDAMVIVGTDGVIRLVNDQTERLFGYLGHELIGRPVEMLVPKQLHTEHAQDFQEYLRAPAARQVDLGRELFGRRQDGTEFPVEINLAPLETEDGILVSAAIRDVSERRRTEQALAAARDEALAAAQAKSQFVAMVSHEIRTPMNGVIGLTKLLLDTPLEPVQRRYAESIRTSARALLAIINDILDFSKIEAGKITLVEQDFALGDLIEQVVHAAAAGARDKNVDVVSYYPADLPTIVRGDEGRLRQVLLNLVGNAVKFTHEGEVVVRLDQLGPPRDDRHRFTFSVTDTGIGIDPEQLGRLFEPFTQADSTTSREFGGTGLGLTITHQLVELMGGHLQVDSEPGHGSRFEFTITLAGPPDGRTGGPSRSDLAAHRTLIVDTNPISRRFLTEHVHAWGMQVTTAATSGEALGHLRTAGERGEPYDVVVLDHRPPELDAARLGDDIAADPMIRPRPFCVLLSRDPTAEYRLHGDVLAKPVGPSALYNCLLTHFADDRAVAPVVPPEAPAGGRGRILLAEDNEINQMVAVDTLSALGYETDIAVNGAEAVELASSHEYQAILMDCQMPRLDGYEATERLRHTEQPNQHTPIIAMTAGVLAEDRQRALQAGMDDFLAKPIDADKLRVTLDRWIHPDEETAGQK